MAKLILVDDSPFLLDQFKNFINNNGHEVIATGKDGLEGISLFQKHKPDLITLDITMPNLSGVESLKEILKISPEAKVLVVSAINDKATLLNCLEIGAAGFIQKPLKLKDPEYCIDLLTTINDILE